jgi:hypothetical protein
MVFVMDAAGIGQDLGAQPIPNLRRWSEADTEVGELGQFKQ